MERMGGSQKYWRHPGQTLNFKGDYDYIYICQGQLGNHGGIKQQFIHVFLVCDGDILTESVCFCKVPGIISRHVLINVRASGTADMHDFE